MRAEEIREILISFIHFLLIPLSYVVTVNPRLTYGTWASNVQITTPS
jgi:hypothetical protein